MSQNSNTVADTKFASAIAPVNFVATPDLKCFGYNADPIIIGVAEISPKQVTKA